MSAASSAPAAGPSSSSSSSSSSPAGAPAIINNIPPSQGPHCPAAAPATTTKTPYAAPPSPLKPWWRRLTHHSSGNPDTPSTRSTSMPRQSYKPRHAGRDALLSMPLAERQRKGSGLRSSAVKSPLAGEGLAVHPNRKVAMERLRSFDRGLGMGRKRRNVGGTGIESGKGSGSGSGGMASISEDGDPPSGANLPKPKPARPRNGRQQRHHTYPIGGAAGATADTSSSSVSPPSMSTNTSVSSNEVNFRLRELERQRLAWQLHQHVKPSGAARPAAIGKGKGMSLYPSPLAGPGFGVRRMASEVPAAAHESSEDSSIDHLSEKGTGKGKGKARAVEQRSERPADTASLAPTFQTAQTTQTARQEPTAAAANSLNHIATTLALQTTVQTSHDNDIDDSNDTIDTSAFPLPPSSTSASVLHERNASAETFLSSLVDTACTSDAEGRNSSVTSVEGGDEDGDGDGDGEMRDRGKRVLEAAEAL